MADNREPQGVIEEIERRRADEAFGARLRARVQEDALLLARLSGGENTVSAVYWLDERPRWTHRCRGQLVDSGLDNNRWTWDSATNTVTPSLHCLRCGLHGFWTNGAWRG